MPSFVLHGGADGAARRRRSAADVAFGGAFYAIVDGEAAGLPIDAGASARAAARRHGDQARDRGRLRRSCIRSTRAATGSTARSSPAPPSTRGADLRNVTIFADAEVDRSPCGTGTAAVMAVLDAMGLLGDDRPFVHESLDRHDVQRPRGRPRRRSATYQAIVPEIEGSAWITGEHTFLMDDDDPLREGFRL